MKNRSLAADYIKRSRIRLSALRVLFDNGGYADVVREAQEVVELAGKGLIRSLNAEPARVHDVSSQLHELRDRIDKRKHDALDQIIAISKDLRRDRELAFYGTEDLTPSEFYSKGDAEEALGSAEKVVAFVMDMIDEKTLAR